MCGFENPSICGLFSGHIYLVYPLEYISHLRDILARSAPTNFGKSIKQFPDMNPKTEACLQNFGTCLPHVYITDHSLVSKNGYFMAVVFFPLVLNIPAVEVYERVGPRELSSVPFINCSVLSLGWTLILMPEEDLRKSQKIIGGEKT